MLKLFYKIPLFLLLTIGLVFVFPNSAWAASPTQSFDNCDSDGTNIVSDSGCVDGGTGWGGDWVDNNTGNYISETTNCQSSNCVENDNTGDTEHSRDFDGAGTAAAEASFYVRDGGGTVNTFEIAFCPSGEARCSSQGGGGGDYKFSIDITAARAVRLQYDGANDSIGTADSTHRLVEIEWGDDFGSGKGCTSGQVTARFDGGTWTDCRSMVSGNDPGGINFAANDTNGQSDKIQIDEFTVTASAAAAATTQPPEPYFMFFDRLL